MKKYLKWAAAVTALLLALCLAACGSTGSNDNDEDQYDEGDPVSLWELMSADDFDGDCTAWQGDDGSSLLLMLGTNTYVYHTWYGCAGSGYLIRDEKGLLMCSCEPSGGEADCYFVREGNGFTVRRNNGEEGRDWGLLNGVHYEPALGEVPDCDISVLDGVWQNALGCTIAFDTDKMRYVKCEGDVMGSAALYDDNRGAGIYMGGAELLYPAVSTDGNSLVLFGEYDAPRYTGVYTVGVFYRDGNMEAYADPENACFEQSDGRLWYYDGVRYFAVPAGYALGEDGQAYDEAGNPFAPEWSEERYDAAAVWGENWIAENIEPNG